DSSANVRVLTLNTRREPHSSCEINVLQNGNTCARYKAGQDGTAKDGKAQFKDGSDPGQAQEEKHNEVGKYARIRTRNRDRRTGTESRTGRRRNGGADTDDHEASSEIIKRQGRRLYCVVV